MTSPSVYPELSEWNCSIVGERILLGRPCAERTFRTPQKRQTVDLVVAKLRKADLEVCKALTQFPDCKFDVDCGESVVRLSP